MAVRLWGFESPFGYRLIFIINRLIPANLVHAQMVELVDTLLWGGSAGYGMWVRVSFCVLIQFIILILWCIQVLIILSYIIKLIESAKFYNSMTLFLKRKIQSHGIFLYSFPQNPLIQLLLLAFQPVQFQIPSVWLWLEWKHTRIIPKSKTLT